MRYAIVIGVALAILYGVYKAGEMAERAIWQRRVVEAKQETAAQLSRANAATQQIKDAYDVKITDLTRRLGAAGRVYDRSTSEVRVPATTCEPPREAMAVDLENERRFELNRAQLEALQDWVTEQTKIYK